MLAAAAASLVSGVTAGGTSSGSVEAGLSSAFDASVDCTFNASMVEDGSTPPSSITEIRSSQHCEAEACRTSLAASMARNYEEAYGRPFNGTIANFAVGCWCEGSMGVLAHGAVVVDTYEEMHATCRDPQCRRVKAHTLEKHMDDICTRGEARGGRCPPRRTYCLLTLP